MILTDADIKDIKDTLDEIGSLTEYPITYKSFVSKEEGNPLKGTPPTSVYISYAIEAGVKKLNLEEVLASGGRYQLGDVSFDIRVSQLGTVEAGYSDRIIYNGLVFKPIDISDFKLGDRIWWEIKARKE